MDSKLVRVAVIGTGSLGQHHARLYAELAAAGTATFAGVFDARPEAARSFAEKFGTRAFASLAEAADHSDALSVVTPTTTHFAIGRELLERGKDVLIEKPITNDVLQARELIALAARHGRILQVGHIEQFNPVIRHLRGAVSEPRYIVTERLSPHPGRGADVGVVLDLMIHDLDIVLSLVSAPLVSVEAVGMAVLSPAEDIANARLKFANGCIAQLTASRVTAERVRRIRVYHAGPAPGYVSLDYREQTGHMARVTADEGGTVISEFGGRRLVREVLPITKAEPLRLELEDFITCVRTRRAPLVDGAAATRALELALEITRQIAAGP